MDGKWVPNHPSVPKNILNRKIGPLNHSRWLTLAARLIRLYISMNKDDEGFAAVKRLAMYCVKIYFPIHMEMKVNLASLFQ